MLSTVGEAEMAAQKNDPLGMFTRLSGITSVNFCSLGSDKFIHCPLRLYVSCVDS